MTQQQQQQIPNSPAQPEVAKIDAPTFAPLSEREREEYNAFQQSIRAKNPNWRIFVKQDQALEFLHLAEACVEGKTVDWDRFKELFKDITARFEMLAYENKERKAPDRLLDASMMKELIKYNPDKHTISEDSKFLKLQKELFKDSSKVFTEQDKGPGHSKYDTASSMQLLNHVINYGELERARMEGTIACHLPVVMNSLARILDNRCKQETGEWLTSTGGDSRRLAASLLVMFYEKQIATQESLKKGDSTTGSQLEPAKSADPELTMLILNQIDWLMRSKEKGLADNDPAKMLRFAVDTAQVSAPGLLNEIIFHCYGRGQSILPYDNSREVSKGSPSYADYSWTGNPMDNPLQIFEYNIRHVERSTPGLSDSTFRHKLRSGLRCLLAYCGADVPVKETFDDLRNERYDSNFNSRVRVLIPDVVMASQAWSRPKVGLASMVEAVDNRSAQDTYHMDKFPRDGQRPFIQIDIFGAAREEKVEDSLNPTYQKAMFKIAKGAKDDTSNQLISKIQKVLDLFPKLPGMPSEKNFYELVGATYSERRENIISDISRLKVDDQRAYLVLLSYLVLNGLQEFDNQIDALSSTAQNQITKTINPTLLDANFLEKLKKDRDSFFASIKTTIAGLDGAYIPPEETVDKSIGHARRSQFQDNLRQARANFEKRKESLNPKDKNLEHDVAESTDENDTSKTTNNSGSKKAKGAQEAEKVVERPAIILTDSSFASLPKPPPGKTLTEISIENQERERRRRFGFE